MAFWKFTDVSLNFPTKSYKLSHSPNRKSQSYNEQLTGLTATQRNRKINQMLTNYTTFKETRILGEPKSKTRQNWMSKKEETRPASKLGLGSESDNQSKKIVELKNLKVKRKSLLETIRNNNLCQMTVRRPRRTTVIDRYSNV